MDSDTTLAVVHRLLRLQPQNKYIPVVSCGKLAAGISDARDTDVKNTEMTYYTTTNIVKSRRDTANNESS